MSEAAPNLRCWLLLCSDLAIRSGTAARLGPQEYDKAKGTLQFRTKYSSTQTLPVTAELRPLLDACTDARKSFVAQLARGVHSRHGTPLQPLGRLERNSLHCAWLRLKKKLGLRPNLRPHDLRRTTARRVYDHTHDLHQVQALLGHRNLPSTLWYLQGVEAQVTVDTLELAKLNPLTERMQ